MRPKARKIWKILTSKPGQWLDLQEVAYLSDMTKQQVVTVIQGMAGMQIDKRTNREGSHQYLQLRFNGTAEDAERIGCDIPEEVRMNLVHMLSSAAWMAEADISFETGMRQSDVSAALKGMDGVTRTRCDGIVLYRRVDEPRRL